MKLNIPKPLKITLIIVLILIFLVLSPFIYIFCVWTLYSILLLIFSTLTPPPPPPQIEYAEFPIELTYEIDGTEYEIKETYICQYGGWETTGGGLSKERIWNFVNGDGNGYITIYDDGETEIYCKYLSAASYMGDEKYNRDFDPQLYIFMKNDEYSHRAMSAKELFEEFDIENIRFYSPEPIENSFSYLNYFR